MTENNATTAVQQAETQENSPQFEEKPEEIQVEEDYTKKVFVGNLSFQTTDKELTEFFSQVGKVISSNAISRGSRSLGYGFVTFETTEEAEKAVKELNKKELAGRELVVEISTPRNPERKNFQGRSRGRGRSRGPGRGRTRLNSRRRMPRRSRRDQEYEEENVEEGEEITNQNEDANGSPRRRTRSGSRGRGRRNNGRGRGRRVGRERGRDNETHRQRRATGEPSQTSLFVANLPFSLDDEGLKNLFNGYNVLKARVISYRGRSKGFGFLDLASEEEQKKVLEECKELTCDGRPLTLKVAMSEEYRSEENQQKNDNEPQEPTTQST